MGKDFSSAQIAPPADLLKIQEWFGAIINRPMIENDHINPIAPSGVVITKEACQYISSSLTLKPHQRLQIYNQQYWWRLEEVLQTNFPFLARLLGSHKFKQKITVPYLSTCLPDHWSLHSMGAKLPTWIEKYYQEHDKQLVYEAALIDWILSVGFTTENYPILDSQFLSKEDPEVLIKKPLCLQPHAFLLKFERDLFTFRDLLMKEDVNFWLKHKQPPLISGKMFYFVIFRNHNQNMAWKNIELAEFLVLEQFKKESSIEAVCEWMGELDSEMYTIMTTHLQEWMQNWTKYGWLTFPPTKT